MEEDSSLPITDAEVVGIRFGLATHREICTASISGCSINHASQLSNPFLGLPLEFGKCESCGTSETGKCDGHFGYIELPVPVYHPSHISELKRLLSLLCLNCLKLKNKGHSKTGVAAEILLSQCCENPPQVSVHEDKTSDGAYYLKLKPCRSRQLPDGFWNFLKRYGFRYGDGVIRPLLPSELSGKGYFPQDGYVIQYLPVPPNCLSVPDVSDGVSVMSSDLSISLLKKVLKQIEVIKTSRSGTPNFEAHEVEANDLQSAVNQYLQVRGTTKASRSIDSRLGIQEASDPSTSTKEWLEKMRTLFIRKGSGFSSRSVITGDPYKRVNEIGIPSEIAQKITFEERVNMHNLTYLQNLVDNKLCLTYRDGSSTYSLKEGSKGHTFLRPGQVVHRRIMDGDIVFINRPPTTHKHSLQALAVYIHEDHTVKINPLICGPLSADFDGDCIHLFYPQSPAAKAEVLELFSVEKQLLSSHNGCLNLQLTTDSLLSLKIMFRTFFFDKASAQQLSMFLSSVLPRPALLKGGRSGPHWTSSQIIQAAFPAFLDSSGERFLIRRSEIVDLNFDKSLMQSVINEVVTSIFLEKGPKEVLNFFDALQPMLMEHLCTEGYSVSLEDFSIARVVLENVQKDIQLVSPLLAQLTKSYREPVELQIENHIQAVKGHVAKFISNLSALGGLIDPKSESALGKIIQQIGFLGMQLSDKGKFYSKTLFEDMASHFWSSYPSDGVHYPSAEFGLIKSCFFHGLDPYEEMVHSISSREVIIRSSRGLSEPGTLFKNLMAILRDVVICYDRTVRNVCSNSIIQFEYGLRAESEHHNLFPAGEPVGVLAATAMSNPAYKAVLDSTPSSNSSWELMKEILLCKVSFKNDPADRRVILYLSDCHCGRKYCQENAAILVQNQLKKVKLKDTAKEFMIEYKQKLTPLEDFETNAGLVGHIHLKQDQLESKNINMEEVLLKCEETINSVLKKKKRSKHIKTSLSFSECCSFEQPCAGGGAPCLMFICKEGGDANLEGTLNILANLIYPELLETVIKGDPRIFSANIIWVSPDSLTWIRNPENILKGELALDVVLEESAVKQSGDAWRVLLDSCLPVLHLIDTRRSLPYAIKQVQELLGISCAFEQAVQRLSKSVTMVSKGILKEHLILLANSMTCAGNLVGFNSGGYKSLSRSLKVQVPFTEATLFTPRKCFERAAEKHHLDSLSSVVAACSWGKHVAVGTGSRFDVLWDRERVGFNQEGGVDVYNFLYVSGGANAEESNTACLGAEVDLLPQNEMAEWSLSPEQDFGGDRPIFEENVELENDLNNQPSQSNWDRVTLDKGSSSGGWDTHKFGRDGNKFSKPNTAWGSWKEDSSGLQGVRTTEVKETRSDGWGIDAVTGWGGKSGNGDNAEASKDDGWAADKATTEQDDWAAAEGRGRKSGNSDNVEAAKRGGWAADKAMTSEQGDWGAAEGWGRKSTNCDNAEASKHDGWAADKAITSEQDDWAAAEGWGRNSRNGDNAEASKHDGWVADKAIASKQDGWAATEGWGRKSGNGDKAFKCGGWATGLEAGKKAEDGDKFSFAMGQKDSGSSDTGGGWAGWDGKAGDSDKFASKATGRANQSTWSSGWEIPTKARETEWSTHSKAQDSLPAEASKKAEDGDGFAFATGKKDGESSDAGGGWTGWSSKAGDGDKLTSRETSRASQTAWSSDWENPTKQDETNMASETEWSTWSKTQDSLPAEGESLRANPWEMTDAGDSTPGDNYQWGQSRGSRGRASNGKEWRQKKNNPQRSSGLNDDGGLAALYTATRQRLDIFTSEEQDILVDIEPLMQSIRRIMHNSGYNDGDPLSADDHSFVLDNVFAYHPEKGRKMGAGIDYFMISKHVNFPESRCLYVVTTDGFKEDFSYRKCLDNFVKGKYPDLAEEFIAKYFRKPRSGGNRDQSSVPPQTPQDENQQ
ncbi:hypothetical protein SLEP1_g5211 [Rubroshorea leprosula]|uniref:DNA-directed RNA polymerase n=1 Tax=Rubroshorea leprosula TaxID=152421 RepID=A0AAV5HZB6_9ROSI|nr:hypothetical protein SLEP1_g5211 [Rubroshorea leprosula]